MRLAILADIHGNLPAFEAALAHVAGQAPDQILIAGDVVVGSPDSDACWRLAQSLGCPILRGNHERYVADFGTPAAAAVWATEQFAPLHWALAQLTDTERQAMGALPRALRLPEAPNMLFVHASARDDHDTITAHTPEAQLEAMFSSVPERFLIRAHNHVAQIRLWGERLIVTAGSVGLPLDAQATAQYLLLDQTANGWNVRHQSVAYDLDAALRRFRDTGYLAATGPMGRLFLREVATASPHIIPFFHSRGRWCDGKHLSLAAAVERFLSDDL
jgi:predicted phosphodiesterase